MKLTEVVARLAALAVEYPEADLEVWAGGDYGQFGVDEVETPVVLNPSRPSEDRIDNTENTVVVRFV